MLSALVGFEIDLGAGGSQKDLGIFSGGSVAVCFGFSLRELWEFVCFFPVGLSLCTCKPRVWSVSTMLHDLVRDSLEKLEDRWLTFIVLHLCMGYGAVHSLFVHGPQTRNIFLPSSDHLYLSVSFPDLPSSLPGLCVPSCPPSVSGLSILSPRQAN